MFSAFKGLSIGLKIFSIISPILVIGGLVYGVNKYIDGVYTKGYESRDVEVAEYIADIKVLNGTVANLELNLTNCNARKNSLISEVAALKTEKVNELKAQAELHNAAQKVTQQSLQALAQSKRAAPIDVAALIKEMKDVTYTCPENEIPLVVNGANSLRNAARGN